MSNIKTCLNCNSEISQKASICPRCGEKQQNEEKVNKILEQTARSNKEVGTEKSIVEKQEEGQTVASKPKSRKTAALLAIFLGAFGAHKFYLGKTTTGIIFIILGLMSATSITGPIGIIEGIIMLTKTDEEFNQKYNV